MSELRRRRDGKYGIIFTLFDDDEAANRAGIQETLRLPRLYESLRNKHSVREFIQATVVGVAREGRGLNVLYEGSLRAFVPKSNLTRTGTDGEPLRTGI